MTGELLPFAAVTALAFLVDAVVGDPRWLPHPVVVMGKLIAWLDEVLWPRSRPGPGRRVAGALVVLIVAGGSYVLTATLLALVYRVSRGAGVLLQVWLIAAALAGRSLVEAGLAVLRPLERGDLPAARRGAGMIVGRDTDQLDQSEVCRAAVESLAENTGDGIVSPAFWAVIGGAPLVMAFKAVSTMDSMIGYKDDRYLDFGWAAARSDDLANFLPARMTGLLLMMSAMVLGLNWRNAWRIVRRDAAKHPSPNAGIPEAAVAGALGVRLGGINYYSGKPSFRSHLGDAGPPIGVAHLRLTIRLVIAATALTAAVVALLAEAGAATAAAAAASVVRRW